MAESGGGSDMFGWNLLYKTIERDLSKKSDVIVGVVHWTLVKSLGLQCLGLGEDKTLLDGEKGDETLPDHWNAEEKSYALRYKYHKNLYILLGTISEESIILNLLDAATLDVTNVAFNIDDTVKSLKGPIEELIPNIKTVLDRIRNELLNNVSPNSSVQTQTSNVNTEDKELRIGYPRQPLPMRGEEDDYLLRGERGWGERFPEIPSVGRGDLDPFHRGPGMIFNPGMPHRPAGLGGHGYVPPGARYDPFGPLDPNRPQRMGPNHDHFRPPRFDDNMFM